MHRGDRALARRCDPLLQLAHLGGKGRLVADRRRHAAQKRRDLRAREQVAEDVVDEEQRVRAFFVAEVFGHRQAGERDTGASARRLVHLTEDERCLGQHPGVLHLDIHVVAFSRPLPHSGEHRPALVLVSDVADELLHDDGLASAGTAEQADLRALGERADQVDDLDPGFEDLDLGLLLRDRWSGTMDRPARRPFRRGLVVDRLAHDVEQPAQCLDPDRDRDRRARGSDGITAAETVGRVHRDAANRVVASVGFDLEHDLSAVLSRDLQCFEQLGLVTRLELDVDHGADDLADVALTPCLAVAPGLGLRFRRCHLDLLPQFEPS